MPMAGLDFDLGDDIESLRDAVRTFAQREIAPLAAQADRNRLLPVGPVAAPRRARRAGHYG